MATDSIPVRRARTADEMRPITLDRRVAPNAEGSCLVSFGSTRVLCTASVEEGVPGWKRGRGEGWLTAEYAMLPRATKTRTSRERSQIGGRTQEIQRLIGRSIRAMLDDFRFGEFTIKLDCDVLVADGGTRTASITGACVAAVDAFNWLVTTERIPLTPVKRRVAAVSVGVIGTEPRLDLDYEEDVRAAVDMNVVMSSEGGFVEVQGTGEHGTFDRRELDALLDLAVKGLRALDAEQRRVLSRSRSHGPNAGRGTPVAGAGDAQRGQTGRARAAVCRAGHRRDRSRRGRHASRRRPKRIRSRCSPRSRRTRSPKRDISMRAPVARPSPTILVSRSMRSAAARACAASAGAGARISAGRRSTTRTIVFCCSSELRGVARSARALCVRCGVRRWIRASSCAAERCTARSSIEPRGAGGFGYDPYFWSDELARTFGEVDRAEKERVSHRARAFRALLSGLGAVV